MLGKGSKVKILTRENKIGIVLEGKDDFVQVNYQNKTEWFPISDLLESTNELLSRLIKNDIDDEVNFVLAMDAYRLHTAQLWDPYVFASSTRIRIFPHQIDEVTWALDNPKTLIADEVGLGKTIIAALVSSELRARGLVNRVLYIVPKSLILKWQDELNEKFETDARILGSAYEKINSETFKQDDFSYIASIDYLKQDNILEYLSDAELDLIIIDEAHKLKLNTQRLKLGKILSNKTNFMMFLTATPHDGRDEDFLARMQLLDPYISDVPSSSYLWVRNIKEDVTDINGKEVFPPRTSETVEISLTFAEENIHTMLDVYMKQRAEEAHTPKDRNAVRFLSIIFRKRSSSSIKALGVTLKRRLAKLGTVNADAVLQNQRYIQGADGDDEDFDEDEFEERTNQAEGFTVGTDIEQEKIDLRKLIATVQELGDKDSKLEMLHDFIKNLKTKDPNAKLILFTEYRDTLDYLFNSLSEKYRVGKIDGSMDINERKKALNDFRDNDGPEVLVCTDAAGEGIDMQFCNIEINYDLPWNPNKLEQRMGRIHRIGQVRDVSYYNFIIKSEKSIDGYILGRLLEKIERIKEALKDKVYDVIGRLVSADDIAKLIEELSQIPSSMWEPRVTELLEKIEKTKERIIKENEQLLTSHRFDKTTLVDFHKSRKEAVDKGEVKRFVQTYVEIHEGNCQVVNQEEDRYKITLPRDLAQLPGEPIFEGTFDREIAFTKNWPYLALGSKDINKIITHAIKPSVTCLRHETKSGLLSIYKLSVIDGKGKSQNAKIVSLFQNEDGKINEVDTRSLWSYEKAKKSDVNTNVLQSFMARSDEHIKKSIEEISKETKNRIDKVKKSAIKITETYLAKQAEYYDKKINDNKNKISEGPHIEKVIKKLKNQKGELREKYDKRIKSIQEQYQLVTTLELIGLAWVIPDMEANIRTEIGNAGEAAVIQYEKNRAATQEEKDLVKDVSDRDTGYDVESFGGRCIEVKSFKTTGSPKITSHEWETARRMKDDYWLYIVENALEKPEISKFKNPFDIFKDTIRKEEVLEYRYVIENWKEV